ncbi:MAG: hypothetical protein ACI9W2_001861, partial [Gammaproteobacteria bacterium]
SPAIVRVRICLLTHASQQPVGGELLMSLFANNPQQAFVPPEATTTGK